MRDITRKFAASKVFKIKSRKIENIKEQTTNVAKSITVVQKKTIFSML
jgi:hypothetical protein